MKLSRVYASGFRNIDRIELDAERDVNWITGLNGAGKTSILEAIFLLARGRSFRGKRHGQLIGRGHQYFEIGADIAPDDEQLPQSSLKLVQSKRDFRFLENGRLLGSLGDSRNRLHVRVIADNAQHLLEGHPQIRRLFLDLNLFHVEHGYPQILSDFKRALAQRNAWLRSGGHGPPVWDEPYCHLASQINRARITLIKHLQQSLQSTASSHGILLPMYQLKYSSGWPPSKSLAQLLRDNRDADVARGYSFYGPARADFSVHDDNIDALPSRGQTKLLVFYLQLGAQIFSDSRVRVKPVWLLDDLSAELDSTAVNMIIDSISNLGCQIFVTAIGDRFQVPHINASTRSMLFHVEHGRLVK